MVISVLVHLFVFFSFGLLLQLHTPLPEARKTKNLEVRLTQSLPPKIQPKPGRKLLTIPAPAQIKVAQPTVQNPPDGVQQLSAQVVQQSPTPAAEVAGVGFPSAVATPWSGRIRADNSLFRARSSQQDAARTYYQQSMEAQARQQSEQQAQFMMMQLQQFLATRLDVRPVATGKCLLARIDGIVNNRLVCDSPALYEVLYKDEQNVAGMLLALRGMGKMLNGFSAELRAERLGILLIYGELENQ